MKAKILISAFDFPPALGGVAQYSLELAEFLHKNNYDVLVVTKKRKEKLNFPFKTIELSLFNSGLLSIPFLTIKLHGIIKKFKPDQIISTLWLPCGVAHYLNQKKEKIKTPYCLIVHGMEIVESRESLKKQIRRSLNFLKKATFKNAKHCFCVSQFTQELLHSMNLNDPKKNHVIHNGVNLDKFKLNESMKSQSYPFILSACRLVPNKGIDQVIQAMPDVVKNFPQAKYHILGDGPDRSRLEKLIKENKMEEHVYLKGRVSHELLNDYYNQAHLFVMLSRQEKHHIEGFGLVFLEAALCKTASLGGASGGIPEAIEHDKTGWIVDPYDPDQIRKQLVHLLKDKERLKAVGETAYLEAQNKSWEQQFNKMLGFING